MHRRWSSLMKGSSSSSTPFTPDQFIEDDEKDSTTIGRDEETLAVPSLKVKRVDHYYSRWSKAWKYRNMNSKVTVETIPVLQMGVNDPWKDFSFVVVRTVPKNEYQEPTFKIIVKSGYIVKACQDVIKTWPGVSWNSEPLQLDPEMFITFFDNFIEYRDTLTGKKPRTEKDEYILSSVNLLLSTISVDYRTTLATLDRLKAHNEITFDLLYAILVPRTVVVATCAITGNPRLLQIVSCMRTTTDGKPVYQLYCESYDLVDRVSQQQKAVPGKVQTTVVLWNFKGTVNITELDVYPLKFHPDPEGLRAALLKRGKKWKEMSGVHHMQYAGIAAFKDIRLGGKVTKHSVDGRIMIDRATFRRLNPNYQFPVPSYTNLNLGGWQPAPPVLYPGASVESLPRDRRRAMHPMPPPPPPDQMFSGQMMPPQQVPMFAGVYPNNETLVQTNAGGDASEEELSDDELILTSSIVYGFSLSDKQWLEFDIEKIRPVEWNEEAFTNLVLPDSRKDLLRSLVEAHHRELGFDDFIKGKGHGLVVNLFGPPGVGKTFSAEATSEHVKRPLYVVGGGDLGTSAHTLDASLERIFDVATAWKAIVLIDEADVFLEQRSLHALERNAMVAVFLRHVEYYRGILFLTTNRVQAFDEAFLSRIHVALHFHELTQDSKEQVWNAFIKRLNVSHAVTPEQITELAKRDINGRQIKNAARTAQSLAVGRGEVIEFRHFVETLDAMADFTKEFKGLRKDHRE